MARSGPALEGSHPAGAEGLEGIARTGAAPGVQREEGEAAVSTGAAADNLGLRCCGRHALQNAGTDKR